MALAFYSDHQMKPVITRLISGILSDNFISIQSFHVDFSQSVHVNNFRYFVC